MPIYKGTTKIKDLFVGTTKISKVYYGSTLVYTSSLLPSGYTECEYIESTGTQWIDTGIKGGLDTLGVETKVYVKNTAQYYVLGNFNQTGQCGLMLRPSDTTMLAFNCFVGNVSNTTIIGTINTEIEFSNKNGDIIANGEVKGTIPSGTAKLKNSNLFIYGTSISTKFDASGRIYYLKVYSDLTQTTLIQNLIPCLDNTGTPCMYDTVSKTTFYNQGTGTFGFKIKANIPSTYTLCEYLQSTGTQYIDTGIACNNAYLWQLDMEATDGLTQNTAVNGVIEEVTSSTYKRFHNVNNASGQWKYYIGTGNAESTYIAVGDDVREKIIVDCRSNPRKVTIKTQVNNISMSTSNIPSHSFWIFGRWSNNQQYQFYAKEKLYGFAVTSANGVVMNLIPCLDENLKPCMYDSVSKQTFYNQGTGQFQFALGGELPSGYKHIKWIQSSTSTQQSPSKPRIEIPFEYKDTMSLRWIESASEQSNNLALYSGTTRMAFINSWTTAGKITARYGNTSIATGITPNAGQIYNLLLASDGFYVDGVKYGDSASVNYPSDTVLVNCLYTGSYYVSSSKNYLIQIIDSNGKLLLNAIPVLDNNNVPCLYDTVSKTTISKTPSNADNFLYEA